jgi:MerR family transcriptional regulator, light-induced transcriptional regulator
VTTQGGSSMFPLTAQIRPRPEAKFAKVLHNIVVPLDEPLSPGEPAPEVLAADRAPTGEPGAGPAEVALSVAGAARGLGVAPGTLRSWERRYGLAPSQHTPGGHRRYGPVDLARLGVMHRLVQEGVPPAEAARVAIHARIDVDAVDGASPYAALLGSIPVEHAAEADEPPADGWTVEVGQGAGSPGGGRVLSMPARPRSARGLARSAMALDSHACQRIVTASLVDQGAILTWEELIRPVLVAIGQRWAQTNRGVEIEHSFSTVVVGALAAHCARLERPRNGRPVLLASAAEELHDLPLHVLAAALSEFGIRGHVIGARTPDDALRDSVVRLGPPVVFLWAQMPGAQFPELPVQRPSTTLFAGGPGWVGTPDGVEHPADLEQAVGAVRTAMGL